MKYIFYLVNELFLIIIYGEVMFLKPQRNNTTFGLSTIDTVAIVTQ